MARGVNKVILLGNVGQDPQSRAMPSGKAVVNLRIATSKQWRDKTTGENKEATEWHTVVMFDRLAEIAAEWVDPVTGRTVAQCAALLRDRQPSSKSV